MLFLLSSAFATQCQRIALGPGGPWIEAGTLGRSNGAVYVGWPDGPEDGSQRFRLRDPNGELVAWEAASLRDVLRFDPSGPLEPGAYVIEHLHGDEGGVYEGHLDSTGGRWYPVETFVLEEKPPAEGPVTADFSRVPSVVRFEATVPQSALWYAVEVEGHGAIVSGAARQGEVAGVLPRFGPCVDGYDVRDADRFRVVAYGPGGVVSVGSWSEAKPDPELEKYTPAGGIRGATYRTTWGAEPVSDDTRPPSVRSTPCGSVRMIETERRELPHGAHRHLPDSAGVLHTLTLHGNGVVLDGVDHAVPGGFLDVLLGYRAVHGSGDDLWLELPVERSHTTFLRVQDGRLTERHIRHGARNEVTWPPTLGHDGTEQHVPDPDAERRGPTAYHLPEGTLEISPYGLVVRGPDGRTTPALRTTHRPHRQLADAVEVRWFEGDVEVVAEARCGGPAVGFVPYDP